MENENFFPGYNPENQESTPAAPAFGAAPAAPAGGTAFPPVAEPTAPGDDLPF